MTKSPADRRRAVVLIDDLMFRSRVQDTLMRMSIDAEFLSSADALDEDSAAPFDVLVVDLGAAALRPIEAIRAARRRGAAILAYGSHVDAAGLQAAREAGADQVVPRSVLAARLADLIAELVRPTDRRAPPQGTVGE